MEYTAQQYPPWVRDGGTPRRAPWVILSPVAELAWTLAGLLVRDVPCGVLIRERGLQRLGTVWGAVVIPSCWHGQRAVFAAVIAAFGKPQAFSTCAGPARVVVGTW